MHSRVRGVCLSWEQLPFMVEPLFGYLTYRVLWFSTIRDWVQWLIRCKNLAFCGININTRCITLLPRKFSAVRPVFSGATKAISTLTAKAPGNPWSPEGDFKRKIAYDSSGRSWRWATWAKEKSSGGISRESWAQGRASNPMGPRVRKPEGFYKARKIIKKSDSSAYHLKGSAIHSTIPSHVGYWWW